MAPTIPTATPTPTSILQAGTPVYANTTNSNSNPTYTPFEANFTESGTTAYQSSNPQRVDLQASDLNTNFQPNVLNNYTTYTYYFILFMLPIPNLNQKGASTVLQQTFPKMILAETGSTALNIKDVNIETFIGSDYRGTNTTGAKVTIDLVEPAGLSLYDKMFQAALQLGLPNYTKTPMYLGLKFQGYDAQGNLVNPITNQQTNSSGNLAAPADSLEWVWPLQIQGITSSYKDGFGNYSISAVLYNEIADSDLIIRTKNHFSTSARYLKPFFDAFAKFCQNSEYEYKLSALGLNPAQTYTFKVPLNSYQIILHDETWSNPSFDTAQQTIKYNGDDKDYHPNRSGRFQLAQDGSTILSFSRDTSIRDVIDLAMSSCPFIQELANRAKTSDSGDGADAEKIFSEIWRTEIEVSINTTPDSYDWNSNDFTRNYIFHIYNYKSGRPILVSETNAGGTIAGSPGTQLLDSVTQTTRVSTLQNSYYLAKKYEYLYTGLNTEVLDIDLQFNYMWAAMQPLYEGIRDYATNTAPAKINSTVLSRSTVKKLVDAVHSAEQRENLLLKSRADLQVLQSQEPGNSEIGQMLQLTDAQRAAQATALQQGIYQSQQTLAQNAATVLNPRNFNTPSLTTTQYAQELTSNLVSTPPLPITLAVESVSSEQRTNWSVEEAWQKGRTLLGATLNQINGVYNSDLANIALEVRGDPYWFGNTIFEADYYTNPKSTPAKPFFPNGEHCFALIFRFPNGFDINNNINLTTSDVINAVYNVTSVNHKFNSGVFTQTLNAVRDPNTNIKGILF
jgi:hypothetical protein